MSTGSPLFLPCFLVSSLFFAGCSVGDHVLADLGCTDNGTAHANGSTWTCSDGGDSCSCLDGVISAIGNAWPDAASQDSMCSNLNYLNTGCGSDASAANCIDNGAVHTNGTSWPCSDGCNSCSCDNGQIVTTDMACIHDASPESCNYNGTEYASGTSWTCSDGCNTCNCMDGSVGTTLVACETDSGAPSCTYNRMVYASGTSWTCEDGCDTCTCKYGIITTTALDCADAFPLMCSYNGSYYVSGTDWTCSDGCNTCSCWNGLVGTTDIHCPSDASVAICNDNGTIHADGTTWTCGDGCHECVCTSGTIAMTTASTCPDASLDACLPPVCSAACAIGYVESTEVVNGCAVCTCRPIILDAGTLDASTD